MMRISIDKTDPGYMPGAYRYLVSLDGRVLRSCITADEEQGIVIVYSEENSGRTTLYGDVKIIVPNAYDLKHWEE